VSKQTEQFRILTARQHVRERIGMYMGSSSKESIERFVLGQWKSAEYVPALSKMIDEILDNAIDEAIRTNFKYANKINVSVEVTRLSSPTMAAGSLRMKSLMKPLGIPFFVP